MAAAVADYAPRDAVLGEKIKKAEGDLTLTLQRTPDILAELGGRRSDAPRPVLVGFAAETGDLVERARHKLQSKRVDLIVANDVSKPGQGFAVETNAATLVTADGARDVPLGPKRALASVIIDEIETRLRVPAETP